MMHSLRQIAHKIFPKILVTWIQKTRKNRRQRLLKLQSKNGGFSIDYLLSQLQYMGIQSGDTLLVHSALSKMGYVEGGAKTVVESLVQAIGPNGHLLMPSSSNDGRQLDFAEKNEIFNVLETSSRMGAISECFRKRPHVKRSLHPLESVCCLGPSAEEFIRGHFRAKTAYMTDSPFGKLIEHDGKILMIGVTFDNAGTNVHCLEDAVDFPFPIYYKDEFELTVIDGMGQKNQIISKVHDPIWSAKRHCDFLIPIFEKSSVLEIHQLGEASVLLVDAKKMFLKMNELLAEGITIYGRVKNR